MSASIVVVGSLNMDMVVSLNHRPDRGETVLGKDFFMNAGGKGANQAVAARKLGAEVAMIGKVGNDLFADQLLANLEQVGVDCIAVEKTTEEATGVAFITLDPQGDNSIVVAAGANLRLTPEDVRKQEGLIKQAKLLMVQLEIPLETVKEAITIAKRHQVPVLLDPAPARELPQDLLAMVDYILPNEKEIAQLTGVEVTDQLSAKLAAVELINKGVSTVFAKLGEKGVVVVGANRTFFVEPYKVDSVDSTAAGDAFAGAVGTALVNGKDIWAAAKFASAIGAITATRKGAQASMPMLQEAEQFIKEAAHNQ
ncbi:ribokinase [Cohnella cholangitidis]|uniref:Ribokinase n=1 Tax=Cohnella cholangitidis TaxID=2598458 RepID=A0A7G5BX34_9BACL|nr:ribokinase [Cohnella cholangitidis]QMV41518.1 ribokinase [Cohnella cholangitidis]